MTAPSGGATLLLGLAATLSATTSDTDLDRIDFLDELDNVIATDSSDPYSQTPTITLSVGAHQIRARAVRGAQYTDSAAVSVTVSDDPALYMGATPALWLDAYQEVFESAGDAAEDGDTVAIWGNVGAATFSDAAEATNKPNYRATGWAGGRPCVEFGGTNHKLVGTISGSSSGDSWTVWIVCLPDLHNSRAAFDASDTTATNRGITHFLTSDSVETFRWGNASGNNNATGDPVNSTVARQICLEGTTASRTVYNGNVALTGGTNPESTSRAISAIANYSIGALLTPLFFFDGKIAEVIVKKGTVTSQQRADMQARAAAKWGV